MTNRVQRAHSVIPQNEESLQPLHGKGGASGDEDTEAAKENESGVLKKEWQQVSDEVEKLAEKVNIHFEDANGSEKKKLPITKAPPQPIAEKVEQHQATHTPYAAWCRHCVAARAVRRQHPHRGRGAMIAPDVDNDLKGQIWIICICTREYGNNKKLCITHLTWSWWSTDTDVVGLTRYRIRGFMIKLVGCQGGSSKIWTTME